MVFKDITTNFSRFAIFVHFKPDADAICSSLTMKEWLETLNSNNVVDVFFDFENNEVPEMYKEFIDCEFNKQNCKEYDVAIVLDCPNINRVCFMEYKPELFKYIVNIDHHTSNTRFGNLNLVLYSSSSTCELLHYIIKREDGVITNRMAKNIYAGIITDTNCFAKISINSATFQVVSELLKKDFNARDVKIHFFQNVTKSKTFLMQKALGSLRFYNEDKFAIMHIRQKDFIVTHATYEDSLGIVDNGINIENVLICACIIEQENNVFYVSLRGKFNVNVAEIAESFGAGGHESMAAFTFNGEISCLETQLIEKVTEFFATHKVETQNSDIDI